ncbi:Phage N-acetylmuramoyl-L-alanine amidase [Lactococcus lactis subsp. lactis]|uniref:Lysin n=3 Tax=Lactococcus lactis TaxID=1358 RepID=A0A5M9Q2G1_LACLH|nr:N-acetylmuramoyl-L-alanine amidase [Lactococcus lactis]KAA8701472.1 lysin [Lactococcus lactis subsp. hordniae]KSU05856.1 Phage N-acetylmuramoyl-L-alanine amidase [Lactococcus lactis subsp. lactis]MCT3135728.1 lysin [Lactococcus lactis]
MTLFYSGIAGKRPGKPTFVIIHNDAGSINACASYYRSWLPNHEAELGFAHVYIAKDGKYQADDFDNIAWHSGNSFANEWALSWEVCQSMGASDAEFEAVEEAVFQDVAAAMKRYGLTPNRETVRLHKEYSATDCPHRSWALHGSAINAVQDYFIAGIKKYMGADNSSNNEKPVQPIQPTKENSTMIYAFNVQGQGATYLFDGQKTIVFAEKTSGSGQGPRAWDHYKGTYKEVTGKDLPTQTKTKEQFELWNTLYPAQFIKF